MNDNEILTIEEAANYLRMGKMSIRKLIKMKKIPHKKVLNKYRFSKQELKNWMSDKGGRKGGRS